MTADESILQICSLGYSLLENRICSYKILIKSSWKFRSVVMVFLSRGKSLCVLTKFWTRSPGKSYVFLWHFFLLEILHVILYQFWFSWKSWCVLIKELCLLLENSYVFLLHPSLLENLVCSRNLFKKVAPGKRIF